MAPIADQVRRASFRGQPFGVIDTELSGLGRRVQRHEYPFRESYGEDLGPQAREFALEGFTPWAERDALLAALQQPGPGTLIHPVYGELQVFCIAATMRESTRTAGTTLFSMRFSDAPEQPRFPSQSAQTGRVVQQAADRSRESAQAVFVERLTRTRSVPQWVSELTVGKVGALQSAIDGVIRTLPGTDLAEFEALRSPLSSAAALLATPSRLAATISETIRRLAGLAEEPRTALRGLRALMAAVPDEPAEGVAITPVQLAARTRADAVVRLVQSSAVTEVGARLTELPLQSYDLAEQERTEFVALIDPEIEAAADRGDDASVRALEQVRVAVLADLKARGGELARVQDLELASSIPAVVLAYRLYGDAERDDEIVARNRVPHPAFLPGGVRLEVLSA